MLTNKRGGAAPSLWLPIAVGAQPTMFFPYDPFSGRGNFVSPCTPSRPLRLVLPISGSTLFENDRGLVAPLPCHVLPEEIEVDFEPRHRANLLGDGRHE